jgi:glycerophosphoryl diester phosphodiesterase
MDSHRPWCIAHRGAREEAPENTLAAFERALAYPVDGIEFDVQMSRDGVLVLFHDRTVQKVSGGNQRVADLTSEELAQFDWGKWFHPDFAGEPLMTLRRALGLLDRFPRMLVEIKSHPSERASGHPYRLTERLIEMIDHPDFRAFHDRIAILSFDPDVLSRAHDRAPHLRYVLNVPDTALSMIGGETDHLWAVDINIDRLTDRHVQQAKNKQLRVLTYTCNSLKQVDKARQLGVDGIISDRPGWLIDQIG